MVYLLADSCRLKFKLRKVYIMATTLNFTGDDVNVTDSGGGILTVDVQNKRKLIQIQTVSAVSSVDFVFDPTLYYILYLTGINVLHDTTNSFFGLRVSTDAGSTFKAGASDYKFTRSGTENTGTSHDSGSTGFTSIPIVNDVLDTARYSCEVLLYNQEAGHLFNAVSTSGYINDAGNGRNQLAQGAYVTDTNANDAIRLFPSSGTFSGTFMLEGLLK